MKKSVTSNKKFHKLRTVHKPTRCTKPSQKEYDRNKMKDVEVSDLADDMTIPEIIRYLKSIHNDIDTVYFDFDDMMVHLRTYYGEAFSYREFQPGTQTRILLERLLELVNINADMFIRKE